MHLLGDQIIDLYETSDVSKGWSLVYCHFWFDRDDSIAINKSLLVINY